MILTFLSDATSFFDSSLRFGVQRGETLQALAPSLLRVRVDEFHCNIASLQYCGVT